MSFVTTSGVTGQRGNLGSGATGGYPPNTCDRRLAPPAAGGGGSREFITAHRSAVRLRGDARYGRDGVGWIFHDSSHPGASPAPPCSGTAARVVRPLPRPR